eukprot:TRINITY_DN18006_c0_g1_i1.p1 TRINITY_DN18006_c0_g1~~TRINITY_DN18006_c0_g1_i1.p1  ORF type:complete len:742 (+),score=128.89 TRINITY_DN18006_c0_g1_i1:83-2308(+)
MALPRGVPRLSGRAVVVDRVCRPSHTSLWRPGGGQPVQVRSRTNARGAALASIASVSLPSSRPSLTQARLKVATLSQTRVRHAVTSTQDLPCGDWLQFHHVQFFVNELRPLEEYKALEERLNSFSTMSLPPSADTARKLWDPEDTAGDDRYSPLQRDMVKQLLHSAGWRITAHATSSDTESVLLSSPDVAGVRFLITAPQRASSSGAPAVDYLAARHASNFLERKRGRPGVGVLAFETVPDHGALDAIFARYKQKHPSLLAPDRDGKVGVQMYPDGTQILDVFAYYEPGKREPDRGTMLRFVERPEKSSNGPGSAPLPGLRPVEAKFPADSTGCRAYSDHWVSNVVDRVGFLATLEDTLGFTPKVDFNAGVVAAGEAVIESTVTGNQPSGPGTQPQNAEDLLTNQRQVYLPINNALSSVGHVHLYVEQLGQGVQHLASRVPDLVAFVERANWYRKATGEGLSFLRIPRSYYGCLMPEHLQAAAAGITETESVRIMKSLQEAGLADSVGAVTLDLDMDVLRQVLAREGVSPEEVEAVARVVAQSRYRNLQAFLRDRISEEDYLKVVQNQVLVDIQGEDVLYQIFTAPVLQHKGEDEAPFLEFIQRKCGVAGPVRPGCGGFGIRNFLTLFLSIEVSKAMDAREAARAAGDVAGEAYAKSMVEVFGSQLDASNPILTAIADAMTAEATALERAAAAATSAEKEEALRAAEEFRRAKDEGSSRLQVVSEEHKRRMSELRDASRTA